MDFSTHCQPTGGADKFCKEEIGHQKKVQHIDSLIQARGRDHTTHNYPNQAEETSKPRAEKSTSPSQHLYFQDGGELNHGFREDSGVYQDKLDKPMPQYGNTRDYMYEGETPRSLYSNAGDTIGLGTQEFTWDIYVALIGEQMLLGIDFLSKQAISLDLHRNQLSIHGEVVQMSWGQAKVLPQTTEVRAGKNHMVPANSVKRVMGVLAEPMGREYIIEAKAEGNLLIPRTLHEMGQNPVLCLINLSDSPLAITKGDLLAQAQEIDVGEHPKVCKMVVAENSNKKELPQHLQKMFKRSCADLSEGEEETSCSLLQEFQDVFACSDLDLGHFTALEHSFDTGDHPPIKQRMRRTPFSFTQEEEAQLEKNVTVGGMPTVRIRVGLRTSPHTMVSAEPFWGRFTLAPVSLPRRAPPVSKGVPQLKQEFSVDWGLHVAHRSLPGPKNERPFLQLRAEGRLEDGAAASDPSGE
ncbi:unnamed protein product [Mytilus coruscus]|uniref:Uncharacterized protein n=1 Tax=Mytilus coruscus TaxID=42192 RepID=A0A6J8B084_MYTCO|nr:unnamed protein product [Mytilus coruscus]